MSGFALQPTPSLDPSVFQSKWASASFVSSGIQSRLSTDALSRQGTASLTQHLSPKGVVTMASGGEPDAMKFYFYAIDSVTRDTYLVEMLADAVSSPPSVTYTVKCDGTGRNFSEFQRFFADAVRSA